MTRKDRSNLRVTALAAAVAIALYCGARTARADVVQMLHDDRQALGTLVSLIGGAQSEIDASYYAVDNSPLALGIMAMLRDAACRGVQVRLLVDGLNNKIPGVVRRQLVVRGVQLRDYHPPLARRPDWLNNRMHDKLVVVDGVHLIVGSRNLRDKAFGLDAINYINRDVHLVGCAAAAAQQYFAGNWTSSAVRAASLKEKHGGSVKLPGTVSESGSSQIDWKSLDDAAAAAILDSARDALLGQIACQQAAETPGFAPPAAADAPARFWHDPPGGKRGASSMDADMLALLESAQCEIVLESPYFVLSGKMKRVLLDARRRGVAVSVLTNSLTSTDEMLAQAAYENQRRVLLAAGVEVWEYVGPDHLHAKSALVDGRWSAIGSYNFDARSEFANLEVAVLIDDPAFAEQLRASMNEHRAGAMPIGPDGKPVGCDQRHPAATAGRQCELRTLRIIAPALRRCL